MKSVNLLLVILIGVLFPASLTAKGQLVEGNVYLSSGKIVEAHDSIRISLPVKKKKLRIFRNAYTARQKMMEEIVPTTVDSLVVWSSTSVERHHTLCYVGKYGWAWQLDNGPHIRVYCFSPKGYYVAGNGGMWYRVKSVVIIDKNGELFVFKKPDKRANDKFIKQVTSLVADDPSLVAKLNEAYGSREKILRMLSLYSPIL